MRDASLLKFLLELDGCEADCEAPTDEAVRADLEAEGIDVAATQARFEAFLDEQLARRSERMRNA